MKLKKALKGLILALSAAAGWFLYRLIWGRPLNIDHFFERVFVKALWRNPEILSRLRVLERFGLYFHNDDLTDISPAEQARQIDILERELAVLRSYDRQKLAEGQRLSADVLEWFLSDGVSGRRFMFHTYPLNQVFGAQSQLPDFMTTVHQIEDWRGARDYVTRLSKFGVKLDQLLEGLRLREDMGVVPPRFVLDHVLAEMKAFIDAPVARHLLYTHLTDALTELPEPDAQKQELVRRAEQIIAGVVYPAYMKLIRYVERLRETASEDDGVWKLPDGEAYYAYCLRSNTTTNLSAEEIHEIGKDEVRRIHALMDLRLRDLGYEEGTVADRMRALSGEERFTYPDSDEGRERALADYREIVETAQTRAQRLFRNPPSAPVEVRRVPAFKEATAPPAYYNIPAMDGSRPGIFYANLRDMSEIIRYDMETLTFHEAIPGHHFQLSAQQALQGVPNFRRFLPFTAYAEGWALYAEKLAFEQGWFSDPYSELGYLESELFRALRLVVDTGIHARQWTRQKAIDYMMANIGYRQETLVSEVERYIVMPGQACAYKIGELKILELRDRAQQALGDRFDLAAFHDVILQNGSVPLNILEQLVDDFIANQ